MNLFKKLKTKLIVIFVVAMLFGINGCTAWHFQATGGTGKEGVAAATAMVSGEPWPAPTGPGNISSESKKSVSRAARD